MHLFRGLLSFTLYVINTLFWFIPIILLSVLKLLPLSPWRKLISYLLDGCASGWVAFNTLNQRLTGNTRIEVDGLTQLSTRDWYLVISNHQSWVDILVLQRVLHGRIPFLKFFLKQELIWVPVLGLAWWALDFPFMRRYSKSYLKKYPHLKGKDLETTKKACKRFRHKPVSIMNFVEGTRFTEKKHQRQVSPFAHLLKPKAGGIAFVLNSMGEQLHKVVDVTICYPHGIPSFWDFVSGRVDLIKVQIRVMDLDEVEMGDYFSCGETRVRFQRWLNQLWYDKDSTLKAMLQEPQGGHK